MPTSTLAIGNRGYKNKVRLRELTKNQVFCNPRRRVTLREGFADVCVAAVSTAFSIVKLTAMSDAVLLQQADLFLNTSCAESSLYISGLLVQRSENNSSVQKG